MPGLTEVGRPEDVAIRRAGSVVGHDRRGSTGPDQIDVPALLRRNRDDSRRCCEGEVLVTVVYPLKKRLPKSVGLLVVQSLERQLHLENVVRLDVHDLAPMAVVKTVGVKSHESIDQAAKRSVRGSPNRHRGKAEERRQVVGAKSGARDDAE